MFIYKAGFAVRALSSFWLSYNLSLTIIFHLLFKGYVWLEVFFCSCMNVALMMAVLLLLIDAGSGGVLNMSAKRRCKEKN